MRKIFNIIIAVYSATTLCAQSSVERVLILNEGYFDYFSGEILIPVSLAAYYPGTGNYLTIDEIENARFASDIQIYGDRYYVAADKFLNVYDLYTDEIIHSSDIVGIRKIAVDENYIVVTRGEYLTSLSSYIQVYDKNTFDLVFEIDTTQLNYTTEGVMIHDGIAYVAVNNGFDFSNIVGMLAKVDLDTQTLTETIDFGSNGKNPDNLMFDGEHIFTLNNKDYTGSSVSSYKLSTGEVTTSDLINISAGCGTSIYIDGNIYYQELFGTLMSKYEPLSASLLEEVDYGTSFYGLAFDSLNQLLYAAETDFFSYGKIHVYEINGDEIEVFDAGVSPGNLAIDVRTISSIEPTPEVQVNVYPNPASEMLYIQTTEIIRQVTCKTMDGKTVFTSDNIHALQYNFDLASLPAAEYIVSVTLDNTVVTQYVIVQ